MQKISTSRATALLALLLIQQGCSWVDSTGNQGEELPTESEIVVTDSRFESTVLLFDNEEPASLLENTLNRAQLDGTDSMLRNWSWELTGEGQSSICESIDGFDAALAAQSLADSCSEPDNCTISIEQVSDSDSELNNTQFDITLPVLRAPIAMQYTLTAQQEDGEPVTRLQNICLLSINEAPLAGDDSYRALSGTTRTVNTADADSLLANDSDDDDVRNKSLTINTTPVVAPRFARLFTLNDDGSFVYDSAAQSTNGVSTLTDSFIYELSDGIHTVNATVLINISASNEPPYLVGTPPDIEIDADQISDTESYFLDLSLYFTDSDDDELFYRFNTSELPDGLSIVIDEAGVLEVTVNAAQSQGLNGNWLLDVEATDGLGTALAQVNIIVESQAAADNRSPVADDIDNQTFTDSFEYDISEFFSDPDGDSLTFTSDSIPPDVELSSDGVLSGTSSTDNRGIWLVNIEATDPFGASANDTFRMIFRN